MLNTLRYRAAGSALLVAAAALTLGACASSAGDVASDKPVHTSAATVDPTASAALRPLGEPCAHGTTDESDVVALEQVADTVGTYCHVTWDTTSPDLMWDPSAVDKSVTENGFTIKDAKSARDAALTFLIEDVIDSPFYDNPDADRSAWLTERGPLMNAGLRDAYAKIIGDAQIVADNNISFYGPPRAIPDGLPRADDIQLSTPTFSGFPAEAAKGDVPAHGAWLNVFTTFTVSFHGGSDADLVAAILRNHPEQTEEDLRVADPGLFDGQDSGYLLTGQHRSTFEEGSLFQIAGHDPDYRMYTLSENPTDIITID
ncbi:hypothetical protein [Cryobacterium soli]|uniref:hypothetical protein n=1 Tax=Cryobacterium soli TaxID=2220095 RepID=UPI000E71296E|nr:hypothetical protein [Cryobacterium soli]